MHIEFYNCPKAEDISTIALGQRPEFISYRPDFDAIEKLATEYAQYKNILVIAHGGSLTSFYGFYQVFKEHATKKAYFLSTVDPDYIYELKSELSPENTLILPISKSGENTTQIEALMQFIDFPWLVITGKNSPLRAIAEKVGAKCFDHPDIGGRYTGFTEVALLPARLCGFDIHSLYKGASEIHGQYGSNNLAFSAASALYQLEKQGIVDVFMPFYSHLLFSLSSIVVQLCHESFGKAGLGQTYFAHEAPESQHHTNQRFFGGRKNICGFFFSLDNPNHPTVNIIPPSMHSVQIKGHHLADINRIPLEKSIYFEALGTMEDAKIHGIPVINFSVNSLQPEEVGKVLAFWQLYAVYGSVLRGVNPFDQPQVENSKQISFSKRLAYKGLL